MWSRERLVVLWPLSGRVLPKSTVGSRATDPSRVRDRYGVTVTIAVPDVVVGAIVPAESVTTDVPAVR